MSILVKLRQSATAGLLLIACASLPAAVPAASAPEVERVVIVANAADRDSLVLAEYYAAARGIPAGNIVALALPTAETVKWPEFISTVFNPLFAELLKRGWIEGFPSQLSDEYGRRKAMILGHRISYLVLMRGVPLRIEENAAWHPASPPAGLNSNLVCNQAAVDAELALLAVSGTPILAYVPNPLYKQRQQGGPLAAAVVRVARLDGPTPAAVRAMIDSALVGERQGLAGRAYVDLGGPHPAGNTWLESVARQLDEAGFESEVDRTSATFGPLTRFDAPVLYFGWYAWNADGPFTVPGFRFPPGAVAVHIHSFSAQSLRTDAAHWCGPLVARGVAATVGNVFEPYLEATHHLDLFSEALLRGETLGSAGYYSLPALSWQGTLLGDPLYRPFLRPKETQWAERAKLPSELQPYVALRQARLALHAGRKEEALSVARVAFRELPSVAVGVSVAQIAREVEGREAAIRALEFLALLPRYELRDLGAIRAAAVLFVECGAPAKALALYDKALAQPPALGEVELLEEAIRVASQAGLPARASVWQARLAVVKPPPDAKGGAK
ncbi:MAG: TIGR03790 family protein [Opitutaceae bacterium]|nr:TIGR03790 family protein [Opitutaceae bacterium]